MRFSNYVIALSKAICGIVKYFGKLLLKTIFSLYDFLLIKNYPREIRNLKFDKVDKYRLDLFELIVVMLCAKFTNYSLLMSLKF